MGKKYLDKTPKIVYNRIKIMIDDVNGFESLLQHHNRNVII